MSDVMLTIVLISFVVAVILAFVAGWFASLNYHHSEAEEIKDAVLRTGRFKWADGKIYSVEEVKDERMGKRP